MVTKCAMKKYESTCAMNSSLIRTHNSKYIVYFPGVKNVSFLETEKIVSKITYTKLRGFWKKR